MRFIFRAMNVRKAIFHCQAYAYSVTCLTDSPGTLICFIGVSRQYHLLPESFNRGWFTELLLLFGSLSGKVAASSPRFVGSKRMSEIGRVRVLEGMCRVGLVGQCRRSVGSRNSSSKRVLPGQGGLR